MTNPTDSLPAPEVRCSLEASSEGVRFLVEGKARQTVPFAAYEAIEAKLSASMETEGLPLETDGRGTILVRLTPLAEIRHGPVELRSVAPGVYGRRYEIVEMLKGEGGRADAMLADADTGETVGAIPWTELTDRVKRGACRSATRYADMLGRHSGRLYFSVTNQIYAGAPKEGRRAEAEEEQGETAGATLANWRGWLGRRPKVAYGIAARGFALMVFSYYMYAWTPAYKPRKLDLEDPRNVAYFIEEHAFVARCLRAVNFEEYAALHPDAARDSVAKLKDFCERIQHATLSQQQRDRVQAIRDDLPRMEQVLQKTKGGKGP